MKLVKENIGMLAPKGYEEIDDMHRQKATLNRDQLRIGGNNTYTILEPGMAEWMKGFKYLGYDQNEGSYVFYSHDGPFDEVNLMLIDELEGNVVEEK